MAESPAQEAARLRRERREAKIKAGGSARLDKITSLSGRTPTSATESSPTPTPPVERASPSPQPQPQPPPQPQPQAQPQRASPSPSVPSDNANIQAQEEYLRALLRSQQSPLNQPAQPPAAEDPTAKLLSSLLGGEVPGAGAGAGGAPGANQTPNPLGDLSSATGLPPFLTEMLMGQSSAPKTASELRNERILKVLHVLFSVFVGVYLLLLMRSSILVYGEGDGSAPPPPPSTAQNPFTVFVMGEALLFGGEKVLGRGGNGGNGGGGGGRLAGAMSAMKVFRGVMRDGGVAIFVIGVGSWWMGGRY